MRRSSSQQGFTLIELLVVISIIAVLAGLSMTAVIKVRQKSRVVACAANLKNLGLAASMYLNDFQIFPHSLDRKGSKKKKKDAFSKEKTGTKMGYHHIQTMFDGGDLDDPDVVRCPSSKSVLAEEDDDGKIYLEDYNCSYLWAREIKTDGNKSTDPLSADHAQQEEDLGMDNHAGGRNVLMIQGNVKWFSTGALEKKEILEELTEE